MENGECSPAHKARHVKFKRTKAIESSGSLIWEQYILEVVLEREDSDVLK